MENQNLKVDCCIAGGGPAGIMLGYLLARAGLEVAILEKWPDFFRDFRGDTIHPSTMAILDELGLLEKFLKLPHNETREIVGKIGGKKVIIGDFTHLKNVPQFVGFMPQWDFLNFVASEGKQYPGFHLMMETEATDLLWENDGVVGVKAKDKRHEFEIHTPLTVGADGRHSLIREKSRLKVVDLGAPIDCLWFKISRRDTGLNQSFGYADMGKIMVLLDRDSYWQVAYLIRKGDFENIRAKGLDSFKQDIVQLEPEFATVMPEIKSWDEVKLLSVAVDHLEKWYLPGLLCIGDAAHAMSPVGGVGINLAIQDAVAAGNILAPALLAKNLHVSDLKKVQSRRSLPARIVQKFQVFAHTKVLEPALSYKQHFKVPWQLKLLNWIPYFRRLPAHILAFGYRAEHVKIKFK